MDIVRKGQSVWYYVPKTNNWKKGKVMHVNKRYLQIKLRNKKGFTYVHIGLPVQPASNPKPLHHPDYYYERRRRIRPFGWGGSSKKDRLLDRMGLLGT